MCKIILTISTGTAYIKPFVDIKNKTVKLKMIDKMCKFSAIQVSLNKKNKTAISSSFLKA